MSVFKSPIKIGIVGTGYAAKKRAEAVKNDPRSILVNFTGNNPEKIKFFAQEFGVKAVNTWQELVNSSEIDLVIICTINRDHGAITQAALEADKHVIVEYPLALCPYEAKNLIDLAKKKDKLLHVEHMELIGGLHQTIRSFLPQIGELAYARYATISSQAGRQKKWSYNYEMFGFPLSAALSRIHRLTNLFGSVQQVSCQSRFWQSEDAGYFSACLCNAQLYFSQGVTAEITYGKGDVFTHSYRNFEIHGKEGTLIFAGEEGYLWRGKEKISLPVTPRRGLFAQDTRMVLDYLWKNKPLYVQPTDSLYALKVADAARISAATGKTITLDD